VSLDNDDRTADSLQRAVLEAGLSRVDVLPWNIVPWYLGDPEAQRLRAPSTSEILEGARWLDELIGLLGCLKVAVLLGTRAQQGWLEVSKRRLLRVPIVACPHPSPRSLATAGRWTEIVTALRVARTALV
jgi:uracil-DNA glycosylase